MKQKNVTRPSDHVPAKENCGRIFLYISTIKSPKYIRVSLTKPHWRTVLDVKTGLKFSDFQAKNGMIVPTCVKFSKWRTSRKFDGMQ